MVLYDPVKEVRGCSSVVEHSHKHIQGPGLKVHFLFSFQTPKSSGTPTGPKIHSIGPASVTSDSAETWRNEPTYYQPIGCWHWPSCVVINFSEKRNSCPHLGDGLNKSRK